MPASAYLVRHQNGNVFPVLHRMRISRSIKRCLITGLQAGSIERLNGCRRVCDLSSNFGNGYARIAKQRPAILRLLVGCYGRTLRRLSLANDLVTQASAAESHEVRRPCPRTHTCFRHSGDRAAVHSRLRSCKGELTPELRECAPRRRLHLE